MAFWMGVLVFIASLMTYLFFPRNDEYQQHMYQDEGAIVAFVNQHQAAKETLYQLISYSTNANSEPVVLDAENLWSNISPNMRGDVTVEFTHEIAMIEDGAWNYQAIANPDHATYGYYTSVALCGSWLPASEPERCARWLSTATTTVCLEYQSDFKLSPCGTADSPAFVMTYGDLPDWWNRDTSRRWAWLRALLKRTHGSIDCGVLEATDSSNTLYYLNNSQKFYGHEKRGSLSVVPKAVTDYLKNIFETSSFGNINNYLICLTPVTPPYKGDPYFMWDSLNNNSERTGRDTINTFGKQLIGPMTTDYKITFPSAGWNTFVISGVVSPVTEDVQLLNDPSGFQISLEDSNLTAGNITLSGIPLDRGFTFTYTTNATEERLIVFANTVQTVGEDSTLVWKEYSGTLEHSSSLPTLTQPTFTPYFGDQEGLRALRFYKTLPDSHMRDNTQADKKRFGL